MDTVHAEADILRFGEFAYNVRDGKLTHQNGLYMYVSKRQGAVLQALVRAQGRALHTGKLLGTDGVRCINPLRKHLDAIAKDGRKLIATFVGKGYALFPTVELAEAAVKAAEERGEFAFLVF